MKLKLKVLGLGLLAVVAIATLSGGSATATGGGHFVSDVGHTTLRTTINNQEHSYTFDTHSGEISCGTFQHVGTMVGTTTESIVLGPNYGECGTQGGTPITAYTYNGCTYKFTIAGNSGLEQTVHFECPAGKVLEFHQPNCLATMPAQTVEKAATYTTVVVNGKHALTIDLHATFETQYHGGLCVFLGTKQSATLQGSTTLLAFDTEENQVALTAT